MSFFEDTMTGLLQAVSIEKGNIPLEQVANMPAKTYRLADDMLEKYNVDFSPNAKKTSMLKR